MPQETQLAHRVLTNLALPYITNVSPANTDPHFVSGSTDILTSINGYAERRPGFATAVEGTPTVFNNLQRIFTWDRFDGSFYIMACNINVSNQAVVYQMLSGGTSFAAIYTDTGSALPFDFVVSNNTVYFSNGHVAKKWDPVNGVSNWGIAVAAIASALGPNAPSTATDVPVTSGVAWANPNNIKVQDGSFATVTLTPGGMATSQGPNNCGVGTDAGGGGTAWTNPNNISISTSFASSGVIAGSTSNFLRAANFGFSVPNTATITGIAFTIPKSVDPSPFITDLAQIVKGGAAVGTNHTVGAWNGTTTYGTSSDLWGATWLPADINAANFGVQIQAINGSGGAVFFSVSSFVTATVYYTVPSGGSTVPSDYLQGTNFGFAASSTSTIQGILVEVKGLQSSVASGANFAVTMLKGGVLIGSPKSMQLPLANAFISFGGSSDLWGTNWSFNDINQTNFGISMQGINSSGASVTYSIDFVRITVYILGGPVITISSSGGSFSAVSGYSYVICYGNSNTGHLSSPTPASVSTGAFGAGISTSLLSASGSGYAANDTGVVQAGNFLATYKVLTVSGGAVLTYSITVAGAGYSIQNNVATAKGGAQPGAGSGFTINITALTGVLNVQIALVGSSDPQVNQLRPFRTTDGGGGTYFELPTTAYPNIGWVFTSVANAAAGSTVYTGTPNGASGFASSVGQSFIVAGFTNPANNGTFPCTAATGSTITLTNAGGVAETHAATGTIVAFDNAPDAALLVTSIAPTITFNDPPTPIQAMVYFSGRIWGFTGNKVWFSGLEEIVQGVPEESFPSGIAGNFFTFDEPVQGLGVAGIGNGQTLIILCGGRVYGIQGNSLDTFRRFLVSNRRGARNLTCVSSLGGMVAWLDSANQVWATDGNAANELTPNIRNDIANISQSNCSLTFHTSGRFHWLVFSTGTFLYVYDIDQDQWMPPWTFQASYITSGETSPGNYVLMASNGTKALQMNPTAYNDNGATYAPVVKTNLLSVIPDYGSRFSYIGTGSYNEPTRTGYPVTFQLTNNGQAIPGFALCSDENTSNAVYTDITASLVDTAVAFNRTNGTSLKQLVYETTSPAARWIGIKVTLANANQVDNLYELFLAYKPLGGR